MREVVFQGQRKLEVMSFDDPRARRSRNPDEGIQGGFWHRRLAARIWGRTEWTSRLYKNLKRHCPAGHRSVWLATEDTGARETGTHPAPISP